MVVSRVIMKVLEVMCLIWLFHHTVETGVLLIIPLNVLILFTIFDQAWTGHRSKSPNAIYITVLSLFCFTKRIWYIISFLQFGVWVYQLLPIRIKLDASEPQDVSMFVFCLHDLWVITQSMCKKLPANCVVTLWTSVASSLTNSARMQQGTTFCCLAVGSLFLYNCWDRNLPVLLSLSRVGWLAIF